MIFYNSYKWIVFFIFLITFPILASNKKEDSLKKSFIFFKNNKFNKI